MRPCCEICPLTDFLVYFIYFSSHAFSSVNQNQLISDKDSLCKYKKQPCGPVAARRSWERILAQGLYAWSFYVFPVSGFSLGALIVQKHDHYLIDVDIGRF